VVGSEGKAKAILGALLSRYVNVLVVDSITARKVLELAK
jgi:DNA-binding transcriptional regulator LsrR (DeoR family)